ncbi:MAG: aminoacyl-histidine dipeptidase [Defluviitaleaceae bacterium]|nr:aminoacyl-histidine dipeptidase [Defluviitaleaceae bacterium]MCL2235953.1 aminoacyl-histidine dipeptidase [Defluviitaleaceae bacterium]
MNVLKDLQPADVFANFEMICNIPHGSWDEKALSDAILEWAQGLGLETHQDELHNLIIKKPASEGFENSPPVILQAHIDMVCEKNTNVDFDFETQGINLLIEGDFITADGTTLGADNGIGSAMMMAVLADKTLKHPPIEAVFTTVEEAGMDGAKALDVNLLEGRRMINLDSSEDGIFCVGCAGGSGVTIKLPIKEAKANPGVTTSVTLFVSGLKGGHSGADIDLERGNSNKILGRVLHSLNTPFEIAEIGGGSKTNAIPREAWAKLVVAQSCMDLLWVELEHIEAAYKAELSTSDPDVSIKFINVEQIGEGATVFAEETKGAIIDLLLLIPHGPAHFSMDLPGLVETSNNLGVVAVKDDSIVISCAVRSSVESRKNSHCTRISRLGQLLGAETSVSDGYPGWAYNPKSPIRDASVKVWAEKFGEEPVVRAIHAGLECGIFDSRIPNLDMISFGPDIFDLHTPDERTRISSVAKNYEFLVNLLETLK